MGCGASTKKNDEELAPPQAAPTNADKGGSNARFKSAVNAVSVLQFMYTAKVTSDYRVDISFEKTDSLAELKDDDSLESDEDEVESPHEVPSVIPQLNVVIMIVGTRGDVQPFIALGQRLQTDHGHRVRLATHACFRDFVTENGLEFYPLGGDPHQLAAYMVKNEGFIPSSYEDVRLKREMLDDILRSTWPAATAPDKDGVNKPFVADVVVSNPSTFGHIHVAEKLCAPLHMFFTMPWTPTRAFPHPLANISYAKNPGYENKLSYQIVDGLMWSGLADLVNAWREDTLQLDPIHFGSGGGSLVNTNKVPFSYCWSGALIPKPEDWGRHIDVVGFFFLNQASNYTPPDDLQAFLDAGDPPMYIGFGSCVVEDPVGLTNMIFDAFEELGERVLVSSGWGGLGGEGGRDKPENVFLLGSCPHDWLFPKVKAVIHHGGAGTTAIGLKCGKPTTVVPFCGDQPFWGEMVARRGAGPKPVPIRELTKEKIIEIVNAMKEEKVVEAAKAVADQMNKEDGVKGGVDAIHSHLPIDTMVCDLEPDQLAEVYCSECDLKMSVYASRVLHLGTPRKKHEIVGYKAMCWGVQESENIANGLVQGVGAVVSETVGGITGMISKPVVGGRQEGGKGVVKGLGRGLAGVVLRPINGGVLLMEKMSAGFHNTSGHEEQENQRRKERELRGPITHVGQGLVEGFKAFGTALFQGIKGIVVEPAVGMKNGPLGFIKGLGKGAAGVVCKPVAGALDLVTMTSRGIAATPATIYDAMKAADGDLEDSFGHKLTGEERKGRISEAYERIMEERKANKPAKSFLGLSRLLSKNDEGEQ